MCDNLNSNPFARLFTSIEDAAWFSSQDHARLDERSNADNVHRSAQQSVGDDGCRNDSLMSQKDTIVNQFVDQLVEDVFGFTLRIDNENKLNKTLIYINADSIEHAIFDRLMLPQPASKLTFDEKLNENNLDGHTVQPLAIAYLFECYYRLQQYRSDEKTCKVAKDISNIVLRNVATALEEPDLFEGQEIYVQFISLFMDGNIISPELSSFTEGLVSELKSEDRGTFEEDIVHAFGPVLDIMCKEAAQTNLMTYRQYWFRLLQVFSSIEPLAKLLIQHSTPKSSHGLEYADTLLGALFNLSCLPKTIEASFDFFDKPLQQPRGAVENNIWTALDGLSESLYKIFHTLLKCSNDVRHMTLQWIADCLHTNAGRGKLWNSHNDINLSATLCVSDGFMLNLGSVLLRLSQPFCAKITDNKVPKIDPTYCAAEAKDEQESRDRGLHMKGMTTETCLIPRVEGQERPVSQSFGFITECFFLTHRALDLGYRVVLEKLMRASQDLARIQRVYNDAQTGGSSRVWELITQRMEIEMTMYLSLRASLLAPEMLNLLAQFHATTAFWLIQVSLCKALNIRDGPKVDYAPKQYTSVTFPLPNIVPDTLRCIPEFVVENTVGFLCFLRRINPNTFEEQGPNFLNPILTEIIALMESQDRLYNPHLRARLAEGLEALLPITDEASTNLRTPSLGTFHRQQLFVSHPHRSQIVQNLLQVFVSIEMTGQGVQFEQKFNYRRPMYIVMDYLWKVPEHQNNFISLAQEAEGNMEAVQPPLFLRFINLLINDAVFLLDEALSNMAQLRQLLQARENGDWENLPREERDQQAGYLQHIGMIARFDNILGRKTIHMLKMLTSEITSIFCHPTMVERIASMLNYLLLQLVGPNKKNLKVNDQKEFAFNPANLVLNICEIYINLSKNDSFTLAVSQDGRSYSPELFKLAENVLVRIGGVSILGDLDEFAKTVENVANQKRKEDEILIGAPDEFLDPIMSTLMTDPVLLPSSKITIDRQTIARHLLSDQTDPFNRSPLTMDMVKSDVALRQKIHEWISRKKKEKSSSLRDNPHES